MTKQAKAGIDALTDREKQTLRLIVRGHDAKSIARELDLSVHTINERLRDARRKLAVSSSREAARMLLEVEDASPHPEYVRDMRIGRTGPTRRRMKVRRRSSAWRPVSAAPGSLSERFS